MFRFDSIHYGLDLYGIRGFKSLKSYKEWVLSASEYWVLLVYSVTVVYSPPRHQAECNGSADRRADTANCGGRIEQPIFIL